MGNLIGTKADQLGLPKDVCNCCILQMDKRTILSKAEQLVFILREKMKKVPIRHLRDKTLFSEVRNNFFEVFDREDWEKLENQFKKDVRSSGVLISVDMEGQHKSRGVLHFGIGNGSVYAFQLDAWECSGEEDLPDFVAEIFLDKDLIKCGAGIEKDVYNIQELHCLLRQKGSAIGPCIDTHFINREYKSLICQDRPIYDGRVCNGFISHVFTGVDFKPFWNADRKFYEMKWGDLPSTETWYKSERDLEKVYNWYKPEKEPVNGFTFSLAQRKYLIMENRCVLSMVLFITTRMMFMRPDLMTNLESESEMFKNVCIRNYGVQSQLNDQDKGRSKNPGFKCLQDFDIKSSKWDKELWDYNLARWLPDHEVSRKEEEEMEVDNPQVDSSPIDRKLVGKGKYGKGTIPKGKKSSKTSCYKPKWLETPKSEEPSTSRGKSTSKKYSVWTEEEGRRFGSRSASTSALEKASEDLRRLLFKKKVGKSREERSRRRISRSRSVSSYDSSAEESERPRLRKRRHRSSSSTSSGRPMSRRRRRRSSSSSASSGNSHRRKPKRKHRRKEESRSRRHRDRKSRRPSSRRGASRSSSVSKRRQEGVARESISARQPPEMEFPRDNASRAKTAFHACLNCGVNHFGHVCLRPLQGLSCDYCGSIGNHVTKVCIELHAICSICHVRGHRERKCQGLNLPEDRKRLEEFRAKFEKHADKGKFTLRRFQEPEWGFVPFPPSYFDFKGDLVRPDLDYYRLLELPVEVVAKTVMKKCEEAKRKMSRSK